MALSFGAQAVWVGTRFVCAAEAGAPPRHQKAIVQAGPHDTVRTIIFTGRPMRVLKNPYISDWEENRQDEIKALTSKGIIPVKDDFEKKAEAGVEIDADMMASARPMLSGQVAAAIKDVLPAETIILNMMKEAIETLRSVNAKIVPVARL